MTVEYGIFRIMLYIMPKSQRKIKSFSSVLPFLWACRRFIVNNYECIAVLGDIELMIYEVIVLKKNRNCLRSFRWKDENLNVEPKQFRMKVLLGNSITNML